MITRNPTNIDLGGSANLGVTLNQETEDQNKDNKQHRESQQNMNSNLSYYESKDITLISAGLAGRVITSPTLNKVHGNNSPKKDGGISFRNGYPL